MVLSLTLSDSMTTIAKGLYAINSTPLIMVLSLTLSDSMTTIAKGIYAINRPYTHTHSTHFSQNMYLCLRYIDIGHSLVPGILYPLGSLATRISMWLHVSLCVCDVSAETAAGVWTGVLPAPRHHLCLQAQVYHSCRRLYNLVRTQTALGRIIIY